MSGANPFSVASAVCGERPRHSHGPQVGLPARRTIGIIIPPIHSLFNTEILANCFATLPIISLKKFVVNIVREGDTIITFNWDVTLENVMDNSDLGFWYEPGSNVLLLKPHGSIDWFRRAKLPADLANKALRKIDDEISVYPAATLANHKAMRTQSPVIVPPIAMKDFTPPFFRQTWKRIYRQVSSASDVYFIGYSLPKEDQFARLVLSRALRNNRLKVNKGKKRRLSIRVANPDETAQQTFMRLVGQGVETHFSFYNTTFDRFVQSVEDDLITL